MLYESSRAQPDIFIDIRRAGGIAMSFPDYVRSFDNEWWRVTLLGEPTMLVPVSLVVALWLWRSCGARVLLAWAGLLALAGLILIVQKLLFYVGGFAFDSIRLYTMSGHSVAAPFVYGSLAAMIAKHWRPGPRWTLYVLAAALAIAIAISRVAVAHHRPSEAISGFAVGVLLLAAFLRWSWPWAKPTLAAWTLALPVLATILLTYGHVIEFENIFRWLGRRARPGAGFHHP